MTTSQSTSAPNAAETAGASTPANTPVAAIAPEGVTLSELMAKVKVFRQSIQANPGQVKNGKPDKVYVWASVDPRRRVAFESLGYTTCKDKDIITNSLWKREDGTHVRGDLILYEISKDRHDVIQFSEQLDAVERVDGAKETFRQLAKAHRIALLEEDDKKE